MSEKTSKSFIDIRVRLKVQNNSMEAWLYKYLNDEKATPYVRQRLILDSLITYLSPLVYEYQGVSKAQIRQSLIDANQAWQMHYHYLQQKLEIDLSSHNSVFMNEEFSEQYIEDQTELNLEVEEEPETESEEEYTVFFEP